MKCCLSIAGSDCSGGAGIQADLKTFSANHVFGMSVITSVVAENTSRVISVMNVDNNIISDQIDAVFEDIRVDGVKVGMLSDSDVMKTVAAKLRQYQPKSIIDPVMIAKGGHALMEQDALGTLISEIIPLAYILTPNIPEACAITGITIDSEEDMIRAAQHIKKMGAKNVLIKGGHFDGEPIDILLDEKNEVYRFMGKRINTKNTHGTGCTLSSAITANIAKGMNVADAVRCAKDYVTNAIKYSFSIGKGHGPTNHFYDYYNILENNMED